MVLLLALGLADRVEQGGECFVHIATSRIRTCTSSLVGLPLPLGYSGVVELVGPAQTQVAGQEHETA